MFQEEEKQENAPENRHILVCHRLLPPIHGGKLFRHEHYLLAVVVLRLNKKTCKITVRILFSSFSHVFNTIQDKLKSMGVDLYLVAWYQTDRPQYVRLKATMSNDVISSTGAHRGTVWCPTNHLELNTFKKKGAGHRLWEAKTKAETSPARGN